MFAFEIARVHMQVNECRHFNNSSHMTIVTVFATQFLCAREEISINFIYSKL